jgi:predicted MPP superfamily phosphohydrolase
MSVYNGLINQQIRVVRQQVEIKNLPKEFEGFTILQISDLHGKYFGENQQHLLSIMNELDYDMLAITGDMSDGYKPDDQPFFVLLDGLNKNIPIFYATGNTGPYGFDSQTGLLTNEGEILESKGVHNLNHLFKIERGDSHIWIGEFWIKDLLKSFNIDYSQQQLAQSTLTPEETLFYQSVESYGSALVHELESVAVDDTLIGITHGPFSIDSVSEMPTFTPSYDLILAGHYHGGQIRLPFIGALYIPDGASETGGFFPPQDRVSGLKDWGQFQQNISRGLGANSSIRLLKFRLFNPPEINLITLTAPK